MPSLTVEVPGMPPSPNARLHWAARARATSQWRNDAFQIGRNAMRQTTFDFPWTQVAVTYEFCSPAARRRDVDNAVAAMKPVLDGLVQAGIMVDDSTSVIVRFGPHTFVMERGHRACVRVTVEEVAMAPGEGLIPE